MANKTITDLTLRSNVSDDVNFAGDDGIQTYRVTAAQILAYIRPAPIGSILDYAGSTAPSGYLLCDGSAVSRSTYSGLFAILSTTFGSGDGSTTFNIPDLRGRAGVGKDNMGGSAANRVSGTTMVPDGQTIGAVGGAQVHTLSSGEMPSHTHVQDAHTHTQNAHNHTKTDPGHTHAEQGSQSGAVGGTNMGGPGSGTNGTSTSNTVSATTGITLADTTAVNQNTTATNQNAGGGGAHNNMIPAMILNKIIKT